MGIGRWMIGKPIPVSRFPIPNTEKKRVLMRGEAKIAMVAAVVLAVANVWAAKPFVVVESTVTNVVVSEKFKVTASIYVPPLNDNYADTEPLVPGRPPRFDIPYLSAEWKSPRVKPVDLESYLKRLFSNRHRTGWNLNGYRSADPFANMPDPFGMLGDSPFGPRQYLFHLPSSRVDIGGAKWWKFDFESPEYTAASPGEIVFGPVSVEFPQIINVDSRGRVQLREMKISAAALRVMVQDAPTESRPRSYIGAMGRDLSVTASLDVSNCKAGDPVSLTVEISGDADLSLAHPPRLEDQVNPVRRGQQVFRVDDESVKTETLTAARRFIYRVRALRAGTFEFPPLELAYYDLGKREYVVRRTDPIPIQVSAAAQAALSGDELSAAAGMPMPDGFDLDPKWAKSLPLFPTLGRILPFGRKPAENEFTWERAAALASRAHEDKEFAELAGIYTSLVEEGVENGTVYMNLGTALLMAGKPYDALRAYSRAERWLGATSATMRGVRAAYARIYDTSDPGLPPERMIFRAFAWLTWDEWSLVLAGLFGLVAAVLILRAAVRKVKRVRAAKAAASAAFLLAAAFGVVSAAHADSITLSPRRPVVNAQCSLTIEIAAPEGRTLEQLQIDGLPDAGADSVEYGEIQSLTDRKDPAEKKTYKRFLIPLRFTEPYTNKCSVAVRGMVVSRVSSGGFTSQSMRNFASALGSVDFKVAALPEVGRPATFEGAVGSRFRLTQSVSTDKVRPGDLVTVTYRLVYDGYVPSNAVVKAERLSRDFKVYDVKEVERGERSIVWTQVLIPKAVSATETAYASFAYYNCDIGRYEFARAAPIRLTFVSDVAASVTNTAVAVDSPSAARADAGGAGAATLELRLGPGDASPVVARVPAAECREVSRRGAWRRMESPSASGWTK